MFALFNVVYSPSFGLSLNYMLKFQFGRSLSLSLNVLGMCHITVICISNAIVIYVNRTLEHCSASLNS